MMIFSFPERSRCIPQTTAIAAYREGHFHRLPFIVLESVVLGALLNILSVNGAS